MRQRRAAAAAAAATEAVAAPAPARTPAPPGGPAAAPGSSPDDCLVRGPWATRRDAVALAVLFVLGLLSRAYNIANPHFVWCAPAAGCLSAVLPRGPLTPPSFGGPAR